MQSNLDRAVIGGQTMMDSEYTNRTEFTRKLYNELYEQRYWQKRKHDGRKHRRVLARNYSQRQPLRDNRHSISPLNSHMLYESQLSSTSITSPDIKKIIDAFQTTLGKHTVVMDSKDIVLIQIDYNESLGKKYSEYWPEVSQFCQKLDMFSSLPLKEQKDNQNNGWLAVLMLRSCWWLGFTKFENDMKVLRLSGKYGLQRDQTRVLEPLFSFAETITEMCLNEIELSLLVTYVLLMSPLSFLPDPQTGQKTQTAIRRDYVLRLLIDYQKENYPNESQRFIRLIISLPEMTQISVLNQ